MNYMKDQLILLLQSLLERNNTFAGEVSDVSGDKCKVKLNSGTEILANPIVAKAKGEKTTISLKT